MFCFRKISYKSDRTGQEIVSSSSRPRFLPVQFIPQIASITNQDRMIQVSPCRSASNQAKSVGDASLRFMRIFFHVDRPRLLHSVNMCLVNNERSITFAP